MKTHFAMNEFVKKEHKYEIFQTEIYIVVKSQDELGNSAY